MSRAPTSPRMEALETHLATISAPEPPKTWGQKLKAAGAFAAGTAAVNAAIGVVPALGFASFAAPVVGAMAAARVLGERTGRATVEAVARSTARTSRAVDAFLAGTRVAKRIAPPLASKVLATARFAPDSHAGRSVDRAKPTLQDHYARVHSELARSVTQTPSGPVVRPEVREAISAQLHPLAVVAPHVADKLEAHAVRRLEFLASKAPRSMQIGMTRIPPSEMSIRAFARYVAAANDPGGIEERLADGTVTPEDREVMMSLYPARMSDIVRQVTERQDSLRTLLPYRKRLVLSVFTGVPVDAAMNRRIFKQLQDAYVTEPGTDGGAKAPRPRPAFGSVKKPDATPAQRRASL